MESRSTALDRRPIGDGIPVPLRYAERLHYFYHFTGRSQSGPKDPSRRGYIWLRQSLLRPDIRKRIHRTHLELREIASIARRDR